MLEWAEVRPRGCFKGGVIVCSIDTIPVNPEHLLLPDKAIIFARRDVMKTMRDYSKQVVKAYARRGLIPPCTKTR